jgi:hypothetical protein
MTMERWCIYIDMQGFSALYDKEDQILWSLGQMMLAIHRIGPLLLLDPRFRTRLPENVPTQLTDKSNDAPLSVDWVHINLPLVQWIQSKASLSPISPAEIEKRLIKFCQQYPQVEPPGGVSSGLC